MIFGMDNNKPYINLSIVPIAYKLYMLKEMQRFTPNDNLYYQLRDLPVPTGIQNTIDHGRFIYRTFLRFWMLSENFKKCMNYMMNSTSYYIVPSFGNCHTEYNAWSTYGGVCISLLRECPGKANHYFLITFNQKMGLSGSGQYPTSDSATTLFLGIHFIKVADNKAGKFKEILNTYYPNINKSLETLDSRYLTDSVSTNLSFEGTPSNPYAINPINFIKSFADKYDNTVTQDMKYTSYISWRLLGTNLSAGSVGGVRPWGNFNPNSLNVVQWNSIYTSQSMLDQINYTSNKLYLFNPNEAIRYSDNGLSIYINKFLNVSINEVVSKIGDTTFTDNPSNPAILLDIRTNESVLTTSNSPVQEHTDLSIWTNDTIKADVVTNSSTAVLRKTTGPRDTEGNASSLWLSSPKVELQVNNKYLIKKLSNQYQTNITLNNIEYVSPVNNKKYVLSIYYQVLSNNNMATMTVLSKTEVTN